MGKCQSVNKENLNNSFPGNYILIDTEEFPIDEKAKNDIYFESLTERLAHDTIMKTQIENGKIIKQKFKRRNTYNEKLIQEIKEEKKINVIEEPKIIQKKKEIIVENKKSKEYVSKIDVSKEIAKISKIMTTSITKHDLEIVQLNNPKKEEERKKEIKRISENLLNTKMNQITYIETV